MRHTIDELDINGERIVAEWDDSTHTAEIEWGAVDGRPVLRAVRIVPIGPPPPPEVPAEISRRQGDLMLYDAGLYDAVQAVIATLPPRQQIEAKSASVYARDNALLNSVLTAAGKTSEEIDQLFIGALSK